MTQILDQVIEALREELRQLGEMLALLDTQQGCLNRGDAPGLLAASGAMDAQRGVIETARTRRETLQHQLAWTLGRSESQSFQEILPRIPESYRPLLVALVQEINQLIEQVRIRLESNHSQLRRSLELTGQLLNTFSSRAFSALLAEERNSSGADSPPRTASAAIV